MQEACLLGTWTYRNGSEVVHLRYKLKGRRVDSYWKHYYACVFH